MMSIPPSNPLGDPPTTQASRGPEGQQRPFRMPQRREQEERGSKKGSDSSESTNKKDVTDEIQALKDKIDDLGKQGKLGKEDFEALKKELTELQYGIAAGKIDGKDLQEIEKLLQELAVDAKTDSKDLEKLLDQLRELANKGLDHKTDKSDLERLKALLQELATLGVDQKVDKKDLDKLKEQIKDLEKLDKKEVPINPLASDMTQMQAGNSMNVNAPQELSGAAATKMEMNQISALILRIVDSMAVGKVDGKDFVSMQLAEGKSTPSYLTNANLTIAQTDTNKIAISFSNFNSPQQEATAIISIEKAKAELTQLVESLQARNITVSEMRIGEHLIDLPKTETLPPPFTASPGQEGAPQREGGGGNREGQGEREQGAEEENEATR